MTSGWRLPDRVDWIGIGVVAAVLVAAATR
jgi:hypothetical protein